MMISRPRLRLALLHASMLVAPALLAAPGAALAQGLAPNAAPQGGQVVGGAASIGQTAATTTITQSTNRAVIDWRSFDVGRDHTVQFQQPSAQSMTLNRVTGPNPSVIAGHITANGGIALVNQSGVVFTGGAQVQAQSVIVSTNDIGNDSFMRGGAMVFDRPGRPGARIENSGTITAAQAGIAALVAPQVANSGVIAAKLGTVVLAGATQQVIDLNGDGLVSFAVGAPVKRAPADGKALVSNTGTLAADGGTVLLTARAADQVVQNLVRAGGTIHADTVGGQTGQVQTGRVVLSGAGGSIIVEGGISAAGRAPGTRGGSVTVQADRVLVAGTARVDASGRAGGGRIAVGTDGTTLAARTGIAAGAVLRADATQRGNGGQVVINSQQATVQAGEITARGGPQGGNGGVVEVSSAGAFQLTGQIDVSAAAGVIGQVIIDPTFLTIVADGDSRINTGTADLADLILGFADAPTDAYLSATVVGGITGNLTLQATNTITVDAGITKPAGDLALFAGGDLTLNAPVVLGAGNLTLYGSTVVLNDLVQVSGANRVLLDNNSTDPTISVTEAGLGRIVAGTLDMNPSVSFGVLTLNGDNLVDQIAGLHASDTLSFYNAKSLLISGSVRGTNSVSIYASGDLSLTGSIDSSGLVQLAAANDITVGAGITKPLGDLEFDAGGTLAINAPVVLAAGNLTLQGLTIQLNELAQVGSSSQVVLVPVAADSPAVVTEAGAGRIVAGTLTQGGTAYFGDMTLGGANQVGLLTGLDAFGTITLNNTQSLEIGDYIYGSDGVSIDVRGGDLTVNAGITSNGPVQLRASGNISVLEETDSGGGYVNGDGISLAAAFDFAAGTTDLAGAGGITLAGSLVSQFDGGNGPIALAAGTAGIIQTTGTLVGNTLTVQSGGDAILNSAVSLDSDPYAPYDSNQIVTLGPSHVVGNFSLDAYNTNYYGTYDPTLDIALVGAITVGGTLSLRGEQAGFTQQAGSVLTVAQLNATAVDFGDLTFGGDNHIATLGALSGNGITVRNITDLAVAGPVASTAELTIAVAGGDLAVNGTVSATNAPLALQASGNINVAAGGLITATSTQVAATITLSAATPDGGFAITQPGSIGLAGTIVAPDTLALSAGTGGIVQTGGQVAAGVLMVQSGGDALLNGAGAGTPNAIALLYTVAATGDFALDNGPNDLVVGGQVTAANIALRTTGTLALGRYCPFFLDVACTTPPATLNAGAGTVSLQAGAALLFALPGNMVTGAVVEIAPALVENLRVGAVAGTVIPGALSVNQDALAGITATTLRLGATTAGGTTASTIAFTDPLAFAGTLDVRSLGDITQAAGGTLTLGTLTGSAGGAIMLTESANSIGTVGDLSAVGDLSLTVAGTLTLAGLLQAPGQTMTLVGPLGIVETGAGRIIAGTLSAQSDSAITLGGANQVASLGASSAGGNFTLIDGVDLTVVAGDLVSSGGTLALTTTGSLSVAGTLDAPNVVLAAGTGIDEAAGKGVIITPLLTANSTTGDIALIADNQIDALGASGTPGQFMLVDGVDQLSIGAGTVVRGDSGIVLQVTGALALDGTLLASGSTVDIVGVTSLTEGTAGSIQTGLLKVIATDGDIMLVGTNQVSQLGQSSATGNFFMNDAVGLTVPAGATVFAGGTLGLATAAALTLAGTLDAGSMVLSGATGIGQTGGVIITSLLEADSSGGSVGLGGANQVGALGQSLAGGDFTLNDTVALTVPAGATVTASGTLGLFTDAGLTVAGQLDGASVLLAASTGISETGSGAITAASIAVSTTTGDILLGGANQVDVLDSVTTPGRLVFNDTAATVTVPAGHVIGADGGITLSATGALALDGLLVADGAVVDIGAGSVSQGANGAITAAVLTGRATAGDLLLGGANQVGTLGAMTALGDLTFNNMLALTITSGDTILAGGTLTLSTDQALTITGTLDAASMVLAGGAGIAESGGGAIITSLLAANSSGGDVALGGANQVAALGGSMAEGNFLLNNTVTLTVPAGATVAAAGTVDIATTGSLSLAGRIDAASVRLGGDTGIGETGDGVIVATVLTARSSAGDILLGGANQVAGLGAVDAQGDFLLNSTEALTTGIAGGQVGALGTVSLTTAGALTLADTLSGSAVVLSAGGAITETGAGAVVTPLLAASSTGGDILLGGANQVSGLDSIATPGRFVLVSNVEALAIGSGHVVRADGGITLQLAGALVLEGALQAGGAAVDITAGSGIDENDSGAITAGLLTVRTTEGDIVLNGPNAIASLGDSTTPGNFTLNDTVALGVPADAVVSAGGTMLITGDGDIVVDGHVEGGTLTMQAAGLLQVDGFSAIATNGPLVLLGHQVVTTGRFGSPEGITVDADSASLGGQASGPSLVVNAPEIAFTGLDAGGTQVTLFLGETGTASGTLDAGGLVVAGGGGATLSGSIAGIAGEDAAKHGVRADGEGEPFPPPPPDPDLFTMNGCPIAVSVCQPLVVAPPTAASAPGVILTGLDPREFSPLLTDSVLGPPTPTSVFLRTQPIRDPDDDANLAPPNIRAEDF